MKPHKRITCYGLRQSNHGSWKWLETMNERRRKNLSIQLISLASVRAYVEDDGIRVLEKAEKLVLNVISLGNLR